MIYLHRGTENLNKPCGEGWGNKIPEPFLFQERAVPPLLVLLPDEGCPAKRTQFWASGQKWMILFCRKLPEKLGHQDTDTEEFHPEKSRNLGARVYCEGLRVGKKLFGYNIGPVEDRYLRFWSYKLWRALLEPWGLPYYSSYTVKNSKFLKRSGFST